MGPYRALLKVGWACLYVLSLFSLPRLHLPTLLGTAPGRDQGYYLLVDAAIATTCDELVLAISRNDSDIAIGASFECSEPVDVVQKTSSIRIHGDGEATRTMRSAPGQRLFNVIYSVDFIIEDLVIIGDTSIGSVDLSYGGMLSFMYSSFTLTHVTVYNSTSDIGGAVFAAFSAVNISSSQFLGNSATQNGGAVALLRCSGGVYGSTFEWNRALEGGALFVSSSESINVVNSSFYMNTAGSRGGAFIFTSSGASISDVSVTNSSVPAASTYEGGAMYAEASVIYLHHANFTNITGSDGFFLYLVSCVLTMHDVSFKFGGGVDGIVVVGANSQLIMNYVHMTGSRSVGTAGVLCSRGAICTISNSLFDSNVGTAGSVLSFDAALMSSVSTSIFENNIVDTDGIISAVFTTYEFNVSSCVFLNNSARNTGGAIHVSNALSVFIDDCYFYSNTAGKGGAVQAEFRSAVSITRSYFIGNIALDAGGAISVSDNSRLSLRNVTLQFNNASNGGAVAVHFVSTVTMVDIVMQYNNVEFRGHIFSSRLL
jgi:predicted outer membrane repeat protein